MNKYALEEGLFWFFFGLLTYYFLGPLLSILISAFLGTTPSNLGSILGFIFTIGGIAVIAEGLFFLDEKNTKYETTGVIGSNRAKKRKEEIELVEANKKWKEFHKER